MYTALTFLFAASILCSEPPAGTAAKDAAAKPTPLADKRATLSKIHKGMAEHEVLELLGDPDDIRSHKLHGEPRSAWARGGAYQWAYGCSEPEAFALVGLVDFDKTGQVLLVRRPDVPMILRKPPAPPPPLTDKTKANAAGISLRLGPIELTDDGTPNVTVSLVNQSSKTFRYESAPWGVTYNLIVEIHSTDKELLLRYDRSDQKRRKVKYARTVEAGKSETIELPFWDGTSIFGERLPGPYLLRMAFPLDDGSFLYSNAVRFTPPKTTGN